MLLVPPCETSLAPFGKSLISTGHYFLRLAILNAPMFLMLEGVTIRVTRAGAFRVQNLSSWVEIGNGSSVQGNKDKWILKDNCFIHLVFANDEPTDFKVCDLIDHTNRLWDMEKIVVFDRATEDAIICIPITARITHDNLFWGMNKNGKYSTKSGYWVGRLGVNRQAVNTHN